MYEYAIALCDEIRHVRRHKYSFATFLLAFNRYVVWKETALQLYITLGDLTTVDVSSLDMRQLIGTEYRSVGNLAVGIRLFGIRRRLLLISLVVLDFASDNLLGSTTAMFQWFL